MSNNFFEDENDDFTSKPVDKIVFRPAPLDAPELPTAKRVFDPAPRPKPQPLDVPNSKEWIPGQQDPKKEKKQSSAESREQLLNAFSVFGKTLSALVILGVLSGIGYFVYWIVSQYKL
jgi:hypothetical protein